METAEFTNRIAIINIDTERFPLKWIYTILNGSIINKICSIEKCILDEKIILLVIFKTVEDAIVAYETCNGIEIEDTQQKLELCVVSDNLVFDDIIEKCTNANDFDLKKFKKTIKNDDYNDETEESDSDKYEDSETEQNKLPKENVKIKEEKKKIDTINLREKLECEGEENGFENFKFDAKDSRFIKLYTDSDFCIDVSNKKFNLSPELNEVIKELRNNYK